MGGKTKRTKFAADVVSSTGGEARRILPSHIRADHGGNQRWAPYDTPEELVKFIGDKCCFQLATIEKRLASFKSQGQIDAVKVSVSGTGHPDLEVGFLRHCAFLLAEVRGEMDDIPGAKGTKLTGIRCELVKAPDSQEGQEQRRQRNYAENNERKDLTPVDRAIYFKRRLAALREDGSTMSRQELADEVDHHVDYVNRHLRLLSDLKPEELLAVHEGALPMSKALKAASNRGSGNSKGPRGGRKGVKHSNIARAVRQAQDRQPPTQALKPARMVEVFAILSGEAEITDDTSNHVRLWVDWVDADKSEEPSKPGTKPKKKKKAPEGIEQRPGPCTIRTN